MGDRTRVGLLFSSSGATSIVESGLLEASLLGIERANADYGARLEPLVADIRSDPLTAARAAHELLTVGKAEILVGCYTSACRKALIPVLEETGGSLVYPTIYEGEETHPSIFYFGAVPNQQVDPLLSWTISHLSTRFVLVGSDYVYPRSVNRQVRGIVERSGGRVLDELYFPLGSEDFSPALRVLRTIRCRPSPVVFSTLVGQSIPAFYEQLRGAGLRAAIVSPITSEVELRSMGLAAAVGHYFADGHLQAPDACPRGGFAEEYHRRFGDKPVNGMMAAAYEAIQLLGRWHRGAGTGDVVQATRKVRSYLKAPSHETPRGRIVFDSQTQHAWLWTRVARVEPDGEIKALWTSPGPMPPRPGSDPASTASVSSPCIAADPDGRDAFGELVGTSALFAQCIRMARIAARASAPVLLTGETGTGKELFARAIHRAGNRSSGPFVAINCAAIPRELIASELFGYARGAFTGAQREGRKGKFELADGGTLFLDEITEMPLELQAALLRALQEKKVFPLAAAEEIDVDVRIIAATNRRVPAEWEPGTGLRSDLYFRLNVFRIDLPELRRRPEDIPLLADSVLARLNRANARHLVFARAAVTAMVRYAWPGNVRELENAVERAFHLAIDGSRIDVRDLPEVVVASNAVGQAAPGPETFDEDDGSLAAEAAWDDDSGTGDAETQRISRAILTSGHNLSRASRMLGISRSTLYRRMKALQLALPDPFPPGGSKSPPRS